MVIDDKEIVYYLIVIHDLTFMKKIRERNGINGFMSPLDGSRIIVPYLNAQNATL